MGSVEDTKRKINSDLETTIGRQPELLLAILGAVRDQVEDLPIEHVENVDNVYITGCGDSYFAGVATQLMFARHAGVHAEPVEALNFSRYLLEHPREDSLLIAISNSGKVSRTIEAATRARRKMKVWAVTDSPESQLGAVADWILTPKIPSISTGGTGTLSYLASLVALYSVAIRLGQIRGHLSSDQANVLFRRLDEVPANIEWTLKATGELAVGYAEQLTGERIYYVGGGPNYAAAKYGAAKVLEALSLNGIAVELEEWAHLEFHTTGNETPYVLIAPPGASYDRAVEQAQGIRDSGAPLAVVVDRTDEQLSEIGDYVFRVDGVEDEALSPLIYCIPLQLIAVELANVRGRSMVMRLDEHRKEINFRQIFHSQIVPGQP